MDVDDAVSGVVSEVGLWWPAADEQGVRDAAARWERAAVGIDRARALGRDASVLARAHAAGAAAAAAAAAWARHDAALGDDAASCRVLAGALTAYADAVAGAKREVVELAVAAGATVVAGVGLAWLTVGVSSAAAAGVTAGLVAAAEAVGVQLSATAASILGGALTGMAFGAVEAAAVDVAVTQPLRVEVFGDGGWSAREALTSATAGGAIGAALGGVAAGAARGGAGAGAADDLRDLDAAITAALDPARRGTLGPLFRPGIHEGPASGFTPAQRRGAELLADEGASVHPAGDLALVRSSPTDRGRVTDLARLEAPTEEAVENAVLESAGRLARAGDGDLVLDVRAVGLPVDTAGQGLVRAVERATAQRLDLPDSIRFVFDDRSIHFP